MNRKSFNIIGRFFIFTSSFLVSIDFLLLTPFISDFGSQFSKTNGELLFKIVLRLEFVDRLLMSPSKAPEISRLSFSNRIGTNGGVIFSTFFGSIKHILASDGVTNHRSRLASSLNI